MGIRAEGRIFCCGGLCFLPDGDTVARRLSVECCCDPAAVPPMPLVVFKLFPKAPLEPSIALVESDRPIM